MIEPARGNTASTNQSTMAALRGLESTFSIKEMVDLIEDHDRDLESKINLLKMTMRLCRKYVSIPDDKKDDSVWWVMLRESCEKMLTYDIDLTRTIGPNRRAFLQINSLSYNINRISNLNIFRMKSSEFCVEWFRRMENNEGVKIVQISTFCSCLFSMWCAMDQLSQTGHNDYFKSISDEVARDMRDGD